MNRFFTDRSFLSMSLLILAASALVNGIKNGVSEVNDAAFLPVAVFATLAGYILGLGNSSARRAWYAILLFGTLVIFLEASRIREVIWQSILLAPGFEVKAIIASVNKQPIDISTIQIQLDEILNRLGLFYSGLQKNGEEPSLILRELLWDLPIMIFCAWSGWWTSRRNLVLTALGPSIALHALILNYTEKRSLSLQVACFAFILLMGVNQQWSISRQKDETSGRVMKETYTMLFVFSVVLAILAGWVPVFSLEETANKITARQAVNETLGLERKVVQSYTVSSSGLPRDHLISSPPENLLTIVFTANTGERPFFDEIDENPVIPRHYWRWLTYDLYNGNKWSTSPIRSNNYSADQSLFEYSGSGYQVIHQTIRKASPDDSRLYWTGTLVRTNQSIESTWRVRPTQNDPLLNMDMLGSLTEAQEYSADSLIPKLNESQLREAPQSYPRLIREKYLNLPTVISPRVLELAGQLTAQSSNAYDKAKAIETYLRTYPYTLKVPPIPPDKEIADYFLFEIKTGYCDYYATSMVVLARAAGLPARLVIGYSSGEFDKKTAQYTIREVNAHSWVEVYFPSIGWVEFEPTANQPVIERPLNSDSAEISIAQSQIQRNQDGILFKKHGHFFTRNPIPSILFIVASIIIISIWLLQRQGLKYSYPTIASIYGYIYQHASKIYTSPPLDETPTQFADAMKTKLSSKRRFLHPAAGELEQLTFLYLKETYSPHPITKSELEQAVRIWRKLFWRLLYARAIK